MAKRFTIDKQGHLYFLFDKGKVVPVKDGQSICDLLNQLNDTNNKLKFELEECREHKLFSRRELENENEELKSHINDTQIAVEIETEKCMNRVFDCIDELIEGVKSSNNSNQYKLGAIQVLQTLEKELKGDV